MICRNRRINPKSEEVMLHVSYGIPDVRKAMREYFSLLSIPSLLADEEEDIPTADTIPNTEQDFCHFLSRTIFANYEDKLLKQLCAWFLTVAIREGFIYQSNTDKNCFYLNPTLGRKPGRPKKDE